MKKYFLIALLTLIVSATFGQNTVLTEKTGVKKSSIVDYTTTIYTKSFFEAITLTDAAIISWNGATSRAAIVTLGGNRTLSITNPIAGIEYVLRVTQDGTGGRLITWPTNTLWPSGTSPTLSSNPYSNDVIRLVYDGVNFFGKADLNLASDIKNGLDSYYTFDGAVGTADSKGTKTANFVNGLLVNQTGKLNQCITFDGSNDYATIGAGTDCNYVSGFSFSFWIKTTTASSSFILFKSGSTGAKAYTVRHSPSTFHLYTEHDYFSPAYLDIGSAMDYTSSTWTHIVITYDGSTVRHYRDGVIRATQAVTGTITYNTSNILNLGRASGGTNYYNGSIDELGLWNRALTAAEISRLYNSGSGLAYTSF